MCGAALLVDRWVSGGSSTLEEGRDLHARPGDRRRGSLEVAGPGGNLKMF